MPCRSRAELLRGGRDGCVETGLPWKSSLWSGSAVTAPTVRRGGRLLIRVPVGSDAVGSLASALAVLAGGGWRLRHVLQPEVGNVFVPGSIESSWLRHMQPRACLPHGQGLVPVVGQRGAGAGGFSLPGLCHGDGDREDSLFACWRLCVWWGWNAHLCMAGEERLRASLLLGLGTCCLCMGPQLMELCW